ncbi:hypothetical protein J7620_06435 [Wohlfahrtiimonas chitiniclastica]|uniref:hypothetical protein n=1 Tax=Wohlfahrtiimonas chitiniclastica TaxID=400946 RepID=UPI001BCB5BC9|nr:hypothetical protein [Wohlfahrtiimonas chitiniclastica]MBS7834587.1 hypothetical protein [Wohlfahrtiimonas chitiniclastica]
MKGHKLEVYFKYIIFVITSCLITVIVYPKYYLGDLYYYNDYYQGVRSYSFKEAFIYYQNSLGTQEPIYFLITYFSSFFISKLSYSIIVNALLSFLVIRIVVKKNINISMLFFILAFYSCFYVLVLLIPADRLKLSLVIFLLGLNCSSVYLRYFWFSISILTHVQTLFLVIATFNYSYLGKLFRSFKISRVAVFLIIIGTLILGFIIFFLMDHIIIKYQAYTRMDHSFQGGPIAIIKISVFIILSLFLTKKHLEVMLAFLPMLAFSAVLGEERVLIFCFFIFCFFILKLKSKIKYFIYSPFLLYYGYQGYKFILSITIYGNGFYKL